jgi:hypothetical protein
VLSGLMLFEDGNGLVWLKEQSLTGDRVVLMRPGERLGPFRLTVIREDRVELEGPTGTVVVPVYTAQGGEGRTVVSSVPARAERGAAPEQGGERIGGESMPMGGRNALGRALRTPPESRMETLRGEVESRRQAERNRQGQGGRNDRQAARAESGGAARAEGGGEPLAASGSGGGGAARGGRSVGGGGTGEVPNIPADLRGGTSEVVKVEKGQTFQGILGLK